MLLRVHKWGMMLITFPVVCPCHLTFTGIVPLNAEAISCMSGKNHALILPYIKRSPAEVETGCEPISSLLKTSSVMLLLSYVQTWLWDKSWSLGSHVQCCCNIFGHYIQGGGTGVVGLLGWDVEEPPSSPLWLENSPSQTTLLSPCKDTWSLPPPHQNIIC